MVTVESAGVRFEGIKAVDAGTDTVVYAATTDRGEVFAEMGLDADLSEVVRALAEAYEAEA